jgi:hypothetical protein
MLKILVIDDERILDGATICKTSEAGVEALSEYWDEIWLDHDLGGDDTIWPVVYELERLFFETKQIPVGKIVIHTANSVGGIRLIVALRKICQNIRRANPDELILLEND